MGKKVVYITRREEFSAAHKLWNENWPPEKNFELYGLCANPNWHGHNYVLYITVRGFVDDESGYVIDIKKLKHVINEVIIKKVDHKNLNIDVDFMRGKITTTENLCIAIWEELEPAIKRMGLELYCVKIYETEKNMFEYYGEKEDLRGNS